MNQLLYCPSNRNGDNFGTALAGHMALFLDYFNHLHVNNLFLFNRRNGDKVPDSFGRPHGLLQPPVNPYLADAWKPRQHRSGLFGGGGNGSPPAADTSGAAASSGGR